MADSYYKSSLTGAQIEAILTGVNGVAGVIQRNSNGVYSAASLYEVLSGSSAPTTSTVGVVNQFYRTATDLYICTAVANTVYTWTKYTKSISDLYAVSFNEGQTLTEQQKDVALSNISASRNVLSGSTDPTASTVGKVNQLYRNTTSNIVFMCVGVSSSTYTWISLNDLDTIGAVKYNAAQTLTDSQKTQALSNISAGREVLTGSSAPVTSTVGVLNQLYRNTADNKLYMCTGIADGSYTWTEVGGGGSAEGAVLYSEAQTLTVSEKTQARSNISALASNVGSSYSGYVMVVDSTGDIIPRQFSVWSGGSF